MKYISLAMGIAFGVLGVLQLNDPDPCFWITVYAVPVVLSILHFAKKSSRLFSVAAALTHGLWAFWGAPRFQSGVGDVEEFRETSELAVSAPWMATLSIHVWRQRGIDAVH